MAALWMLFASLSFACMGVCIKLASVELSTAESVFYRSFIAFLIVQGLVLVRRRSVRTRHLKAQVLRAGVGCTAIASYFSAIALIPLATAVTLTYTSPLFMALILWAWYQEPVRPKAFLALLVGFAGVVMLLHPSLNQQQWMGAAVGLLAGVLSTFAVLNVRKLGQLGEPEWLTVYYFSAGTSLMGLVWTLLQGGFHPLHGNLPWLALGMGLFGFGGQMAMTTAFSRGKAIVVANLSYSTVVYASLFGILVWGEVLPWSSWLGIGLIIASSIAMSLFSSARPQPVDPD